MPGPKPTAEQESSFERYKLRCPPARSAACSLINYIEYEHPLEDNTREERLMVVSKVQEEWIGKPVCHPITGDPVGTVVYLLARSNSEMRDQRFAIGVRSRASVHAYGLSRFKAIVNRDGHLVTLGLEKLDLCEEAPPVP